MLAPTLVETGSDHTSVRSHRPHGLVQRAVVAAQLNRDINAQLSGQRADLLAGTARGIGGNGVARSHCDGKLAARLKAVDGDHAGSAQVGQPRGEQADHSLAEDGDVFSEVKIGAQHGVQRNGAHPGENSVQRIGSLGNLPASHRLRSDHSLTAMSPDPIDNIAYGQLPHVLSNFDHLTHLRIAPADHRVAMSRRSFGEDPLNNIPAFGQVGVRASVGSELGSGRNSRVPGADPDRARRQRLSFAFDQFNRSGRGELHDVRHGFFR